MSEGDADPVICLNEDGKAVDISYLLFDSDFVSPGIQIIDDACVVRREEIGGGKRDGLFAQIFRLDPLLFRKGISRIDDDAVLVLEEDH